MLPSHFRSVFDPRRLAAVRRHGVMGSGCEPVFELIVRNAADVCRTPMAFLTFLDDRRQWIKASHGAAAGETPLDHAVCAAAIEDGGDLFVVVDCANDPRVNWCPPVHAAERPVAFYAGALLHGRDGFPLGTLCVVDVRARPKGLDVEQSAKLRSLAGAAMDVLDARLEIAEALKDEPAATTAP